MSPDGLGLGPRMRVAGEGGVVTNNGLVALYKAAGTTL